MNNLEFINICIIVVLILLIAILIYFKNVFNGSKTLWNSLFIFLTIYLFIIIPFSLTLYYKYKVRDFTDEYGIVNVEIMSSEQEYFFNELINDTGRNFSIITGFVVSIIISVLYMIISELIYGIRRKL
jgi:energy-coupling factor transporter transmembrane protein EcfT